MKKIVTLLLFLSAAIPMHAQTSWDLKKDSEGIKVYTRNVPNSNIKAIRVTCILNANLSQLTALLLDVPAHEKWVYNARTSYIVKQLGPGHIIYYTEISLSWPVTNRDLVVEMQITQQPETKILYVSANSTTQYMPAKKDKVRVPMSKVNWIVTPISQNQLSVEYTALADPGGSIPAWVVNSVSTIGPFETFKKLKELVASPAYSNAQFAFITN